MFAHSTAAANAILQSHSMSVRCSVRTPTYGRVTDLPVSDGTVTVDATSQVRRSATVDIPLDSFWPRSPFDVLSPLGSEMGIEYGIILPSGATEWIPLMLGPIQSVQRRHPTESGQPALAVEVADRSSKIAEARFDAPVQTVTGATAVAEITRLITDVLPDVGVTDYTLSTKVNPVMEIERDRWGDGIEKIADSIGAEVFADAMGGFSIRLEPTVANSVVWTYTADESGIVVSQDDEYSRERTYNRVVASGQRTDGTPPVYAVVEDTNPNSPTYIGGAFGTKTRFYASPLLTTVAQCQLAAATVLARVTGHHLNVSFDSICHPALDAGDVIRLQTGGRDELHIIDTIQIPLTPDGVQRIGTRALVLPEEA